MKKGDRLYTDDEVCRILKISKSTLRRQLRSGPARSRVRNAGDIRLIQHIRIGTARRWLSESLEQFITQ